MCDSLAVRFQVYSRRECHERALYEGVYCLAMLPEVAGHLKYAEAQFPTSGTASRGRVRSDLKRAQDFPRQQSWVPN